MTASTFFRWCLLLPAAFLLFSLSAGQDHYLVLVIGVPYMAFAVPFFIYLPSMPSEEKLLFLLALPLLLDAVMLIFGAAAVVLSPSIELGVAGGLALWNIPKVFLVGYSYVILSLLTLFLLSKTGLAQNDLFVT